MLVMNHDETNLQPVDSYGSHTLMLPFAASTDVTLEVMANGEVKNQVNFVVNTTGK